ncbi:hypothetical protein NM688_g5374 [Phlebia brevispora]|uniref:Uncharacterized protein n=1 Tax=Phlebia brevispora TaxID=194682 RepID=A0ACC1SWM3_9APHY|nr:hypothetical protein NM688_g5374 [Phlebia brevispora]
MATKPKPSARSRTKPTHAPSAPDRLTRASSAKAISPTLELKSQPAEKKASSRMPLLNRSNSPDKVPARSSQKTLSVPKASSYAVIDSENDREPIKAFLRIRPQTNDDAEEGSISSPYLEPISDTAVRMLDPSSSNGLHSRASTINPSSVYTFSHIFPPSTHQPEFFTKTTLPLVKDVLEGQSCLLFTYGVTNSGKTYTIQGGHEEGSAGILPRTLDVIFNSVEGLQGDGRYQPVRLQGVELAPESCPSSPISQYVKSSKRSLVDLLDESATADLSDIDHTTLKLDRNYEYSIWLSYTEVYNEKVYDLFSSVDDPSAADVRSTPTTTGIPRPTSTFLNLPLPTSQSKPLLLSRKALQVKPCPLADYDGTSDAGSQGKYIAGLRQLRVTSAAQAKALLRLGQMHRRVFGTLANSQSSRSHAIVTIKVLKLHRGERNNSAAIQTSRLTLVDLAGSERTKHTQTSGERLREAGNINKSLMVLGQCMETMRTNQRIIARSLEASVDSGSRLDTRDVKKGLAIVPFRHSKLTEILMDYFVGEGRVVMIVNVNPYDTGYDENSHVMKFSALTREVATTAPTAVSRIVPYRAKSGLGSVRNSDAASHRRKVTISTGGPGKKMSEAHLEVLEEDEEPGDEDDDEPINPLVNALFDEIEALRMQLFESEMRCAIIEADTREEVMQEMEERMHNMEKMYTRRLMKEIEQNEAKMDAKIDMIQRANSQTLLASSSVEEDLQDITEEDEIESTPEDEPNDYEHGSDSEFGPSRSPSPLASKGNAARRNR